MQNGKFYGRFPGDAEQVRRIVRFLIAQPDGGVRTPSGNFLSPQGLQSLGCPGACPCLPSAEIVDCNAYRTILNQQESSSASSEGIDSN